MRTLQAAGAGQAKAGPLGELCAHGYTQDTGCVEEIKVRPLATKILFTPPATP